MVSFPILGEYHRSIIRTTHMGKKYHGAYTMFWPWYMCYVLHLQPCRCCTFRFSVEGGRVNAVDFARISVGYFVDQRWCSLAWGGFRCASFQHHFILKLGVVYFGFTTLLKFMFCLERSRVGNFASQFQADFDLETFFATWAAIKKNSRPHWGWPENRSTYPLGNLT